MIKHYDPFLIGPTPASAGDVKCDHGPMVGIDVNERRYRCYCCPATFAVRPAELAPKGVVVSMTWDGDSFFDPEVK